MGTSGAMNARPAEATKVIQINELANSMKEELDHYWLQGEAVDNGGKSCIIYKVQQHIRQVDRFSYEPLMISIGPYHHGVAHLQAMEKWKWGYLDAVINLNREKHLAEYLNAVGGLVKQARYCYSEDINMANDKFLQMLLLDGCFILVALGGIRGTIAATQNSTDPTNSQERYICNLPEIVVEYGKEPRRMDPDKVQNEIPPVEKENSASTSYCQVDENMDEECDEQHNSVGLWFLKFFNHDLFLLENQIPFVVVRKIYELGAGKCTVDPPFTDEIVKYIEAAMHCYPKAIKEDQRPKDFDHLLHLCHMYLRPSMSPEEAHSCNGGPRYLQRFLRIGRQYLKLGSYPEDDERASLNQEGDNTTAGEQLNRWRRASQYLESGVKFKKREYSRTEPHSLLDVKFSNGKMEIPCLVVDEHTGSLFRNVIALEQTCPQIGDDFTAYIVLMSQLMSTPEDVTLLARNKIIVHHLDSDAEASDMFTLLSKDVVFDFNGNYYLKGLCQTMERHYQSRSNRWIAWLWQNHFSNPWLSLAAAATVIVLICTVVQTVFSILSYIKPST